MNAAPRIFTEYEDMSAWKRQFAKYLKSSRIDRVRENTLVF